MPSKRLVEYLLAADRDRWAGIVQAFRLDGYPDDEVLLRSTIDWIIAVRPHLKTQPWHLSHWLTWLGMGAFRRLLVKELDQTDQWIGPGLHHSQRS